MSGVPDPELDLLCNTVTEAVDYAAAGCPEEGYAALCYGLERARALEAEPWREELAGRYQEALRRYAREYLGGNGSREAS